MLTLNLYLDKLQSAGKLNFAGEHYSDGLPVWTGYLWRAFGDDGAKDGKKTRLERALDLCAAKNISVRFEDEIISDERGRAHEINPGFHGQTPTWKQFEGEIWARDEVKSESEIANYAERLMNDMRNADQWEIDFAPLGFAKFDYEAEAGFHPGQSDTPESLAARVRATHPGADLIFAISDVGQFDCHFFAWYKVEAAE